MLHGDRHGLCRALRVELAPGQHQVYAQRVQRNVQPVGAGLPIEARRRTLQRLPLPPR